MTSSSNSQDKKSPELCTMESLKKLFEKNPKLLLILNRDDRKDFVKKFLDVAAPEDLYVATMEAGSSCEIPKELGEGDKSSAVLLENGEVKSRIILEDDDVKDTASLMKMLSEKRVPEDDSCKAEFKIDKKGWRLKPDTTVQCKRELSKVDELRPATKKYIRKHISEE